MKRARLTPAQEAVLAWLVAYPDVRLTAYPGGSVGWTERWASAEANGRAPSDTPIAGATPRITRPTYQALQRLGALRMVSYQKPNSGWSFCTFYRISEHGLDLLLDN